MYNIGSNDDVDSPYLADNHNHRLHKSQFEMIYKNIEK